MGRGSSHMMPAPVIVNATARHTATVIFLHGLGDTGNGWSQAFQLIARPHIKYICPTAAVMPVSLNGGFPCPSWFDIFGLEPNSREDEVGIKSASVLLQQLVAEEEKAGIQRSRIAVGGFSQGGAVALYSSLSITQQPLAGIIGLSTWLPLHKSLKEIKANNETKMLQCHGEADPLVRFQFGKLTGDLLHSHNKNHRFKGYAGMGHSSCEKEMNDVQAFIDEILPSKL